MFGRIFSAEIEMIRFLLKSWQSKKNDLNA